MMKGKMLILLFCDKETQIHGLSIKHGLQMPNGLLPSLTSLNCWQ